MCWSTRVGAWVVSVVDPGAFAAGILDAVLQGGEIAIDQGLEFETQGFALAFSTEDMREGTTAFLEKRKPQFSGR